MDMGTTRKRNEFAQVSRAQLQDEIGRLERIAERYRWQPQPNYSVLELERNKLTDHINQIQTTIQRLRDDPHNKCKVLFGLGGMRWTDSCESQCSRLKGEINTLVVRRSEITERLKQGQLALRRLENTERALLKAKRAMAKYTSVDALKLRAERSEKEIRRKAISIKRKLQSDHSLCPYCGGPMSDDAHADHIYPVVKGGLSIEPNMVIVCSTCNLRKRGLTLREFIKAFKMNRDEIERRLEALGKHF
jgi:5-methylcytosine-specific restriction endonuclease McrA